ncbi:neuron navigator 1-like [Oncorhynchus clarkii lewisi]|uniref:neuron navigator 1-like n=1 Tax=Oncorhynchus clarkii lewisi TaxID=490388 RepID=UPI0039B9C25C
MSGGVNIKTISQAQPSSGLVSGIPLPQRITPLSKLDPKHQGGSALSNPTAQFQLSTKMHPSYSSSSSSFSNELLSGAALRGGICPTGSSSRVSYAPERGTISRSAYSSPQVPKRQTPPPRSKDTLDLRSSNALSQKAFREHTRRNANGNWASGAVRHSRLDDNGDAQDALSKLSGGDLHSGQSRLSSTKAGNGNLISAVLMTTHQEQREPRNLSCHGMIAPKKDMSTNKHRASHLSQSGGGGTRQTVSVPRRGSEPARSNMATVAPFRFRLNVQDDDASSLEDLSDCSSDSMEVCCDDLGGIVRSSVKGGREGDLKMERAESTKTYGQAEGKAVGMAAKRGKSGVPQSAQRGELRVYRAGSSEGRLPVSSNLRKQRSMTNLAVLTDAEKKIHLYEPKWCDDMAKPGAGPLKAGKPKLAGGGGGGGRGGAPLSRNLSKSEHSLFQGKPKTFSPLAAPSGLVRPSQSRIPRAPYAEVKPLSKAPEDGKSDDEILSSKAKAASKKQAVGASVESEAKSQGDGSQSSFLKVDPELVVTVLGDLEQLLFSQMLDPESQRKRTVQNVLDLRQNLEDTMSSLRGAQLSHGCLDSSTVCYDSDETNGRSMSSQSNRSSPLSWRHGQSSPRMQAGDAPSSTGSGGYQGGKAGSQYTAHTMPARVSSRFSHSSRMELIEGLDVDDADLKSGYLSDTDLLGKSMPEDDDDNLANGWEESSSISSGLSDGSVDNLSSEEFNASSSLNSLPTTPLGSRRNSSVMLRTDAEKRSLVESGLSWYSEDAKAARKMDGGSYETGSLKTETPSKWRKSSRPMEGASEDAGVKGELRKPQILGQPGNFNKKGRHPPVGVTSPITHTSQSVLKVAAPKSDHRAVDKTKMSVKAAGLQRSRSDAGRDHLPQHRELRKPPSGLVKPSAGASFGYKRLPTTSTATVMTAGGSTISGGSATLGKMPKSSGIPVKPLGVGGGGGRGGRKNSFDATGSEEGGFLGPSARNSLQYRSLPRPAKSSTLSLIGRPGSARPASSCMDPGLLSLKPISIACPGPRGKETGSGSTKGASRGGSTGPVNQTDREKEKERAKAKAVASDMGSLCGSLKMADCQGDSTGETSAKLHGLRRASSSKYPELSSPTTQRMLSCKSLGRPPSLAHLDKVNSNSLDSCVTIQDLPPKVPPYSKLQDLAGSVPRSTIPRGLTPSPAPILHLDSPSCYPNQTLSMGGSPLLYPKLSGLHRSMESLPLTMSVPPSGGYIRAESRDRDRDSYRDRDREETRSTGTWGAGSRTSLNLPDSLQTDRNTLPKKGLGYVNRYSSGLSEDQSEGKERRHSHTAVSLMESESPPQLPSPTHIPHLSSGKAVLTNVVAPIPSGAPRITRSNSIPTNDMSFDLYGTSPLGSTMSLADRPKSMMRSGSFREPGDDCETASTFHGSVLSLASNTSSNYSSTEERIQGEQIRKLRRELENSQEKVANLTTQLSANLGQANLVAAFEQSLQLMTSRLQTLSVSQEQKVPDSELTDLKETIEILKTKNTEAQDIIHVALSNPEIPPEELQMKRQNSSESISSLNSISSHSSLSSLKEQEAKKKKKSWLRSSFNKAFSKKGSKLSASYADIEEIATPDSSAPSSPKITIHHGDRAGDGDNPPSVMRSSVSASSSGLCEGGEDPPEDEKVVSTLRSALWEKERKLTDIRLEALSSAHQLEQLQEAMNNMQMTVENLKAENDQLKTGGPSTSTSQSSSLASLGTASPRESVAISLTKTLSMSLGEGSSPDLFQTEAASLPSHRDDPRVRVVVRVANLRIFKDEVKQQDFFIGTVRVNGRMDWPMLDSAVGQAFKVYIAKVDPTSSLGLSTDSIYSYSMNHIRRVLGGELPESQPSHCVSKGPSGVTVTLKGLKEKCVDSLVFETLIPKPMSQHYISLLLKHRRLILSGPSGTGKTYLTSHLAEYLVDRSGRDLTDGIVVTFNMHRQSCKDLQLYLSNLANQIDRETSTAEIPLVVILDDIHDAISISELVNGALTCKYHKCPYIIGTTNQPVKMTPNHSLHLSFRMVTFSNNVEPANGFLVRYLHRKLMEAEDERSLANEDLLRVLDWVPKLWYHLHTFLEKHSTSDFLIGPCFFLSCPVTVEEFRSWFIDLWNLSIIPYLQEGAKDGIKVHGQKAVWEDPVEWVRGTLPWPSAQQDQAKLFHLPPPSMTSGGPGQPSEASARPLNKETPPSSMDTLDPLMAMLLKLQEAANYIESPDRETMDPSLPTL